MTTLVSYNIPNKQDSRIPTEAGKHGFLAPLRWDGAFFQPLTFSIGVFEASATADGTKLKAGKAKIRVVGSPSAFHAVIETANRVAEALDAGTYKGPKNVQAGSF